MTRHTAHGKDGKTIREGIREAEEDASGERLRESPDAEKGKPEAVNLERDEPVTNAARRSERD